MSEPAEQPIEAMHFYGSLTVPLTRSNSQVMRWGDAILLTDEIKELSLDRYGKSWIDLADDEPEQVRRWGKVMFRRGDWPDDLPPYEPGSMEEEDAREAARVAAWKIPHDEERYAALKEITKKFGPMKVTSRTFDTREQ